MVTTIRLSCPSCAAAVTTEQKNCAYCGSEVIIRSFTQINSMPMPQVNKYAVSYRKSIAESPDAAADKDINISLGLCYLRLKLYDKAIEAFESAIKDNFDNSEVYYYTSIALLKGQKAFVTPRPNIDKIVEYLNAALMIEDKSIYHYFLAYIKRDYFHRKYLKVDPDHVQCFQAAVDGGISRDEINELHHILGVE